MSAIKAKFILQPEFKGLRFRGSSLKSQVSSVMRHILMLLWLLKWQIILASLFMGLFLNILYNEMEIQRYVGERKLTQAQVMNCEEGPAGSRNGPVTHITYRYDAGAEAYIGEVDLGAPYCTIYPVGTWVPLSYRSSNPAESHFNREVDPPYSAPHIVSGLFIVFLMLASTSATETEPLHAYLRNHRVGRQIASQCTLLEGEIIGVQGSRHGNDFMVTIEYEFLTPQKKMLVGTTSAYRRDLDSTKLPPVGLPIVVCYVNDRVHMAL
jgi:hypothetical protein